MTRDDSITLATEANAPPTPTRSGRWKVWLGNVIYWMFSFVAIFTILFSNGYPRFELGSFLIGCALYIIGRDMRHVLINAEEARHA